MGIHVIQSQRLDVLLEGVFKSRIKPSRHAFSVLKAQHFIVPGPAVQEWLTLKISEHQGVSANTLFHQRIRGFQWYAYQQVLSNKDKVRKANIPRLVMKWRIYQILKAFIETEHNLLAENHPLFSIVQRIYDAAAELTDPVQKQLKKQSMLYWVAERVSVLFSNYMLYRGECQQNCQQGCKCSGNWLVQWGQGKALNLEQQFFKTRDEVSAFTFSQAQQLEEWQRWLWQHTFHEDFVEMQSIDADFWQIMDNAVLREEALSKLPAQVTVFTLLDLPPAQLNFLRRLGQHIDIVILHYNPSQEYWADSVDPNWKKQYDLRVKERFIVRHPEATDEDIQKFFDEFTLNFNAEIRESRHPLLTRFGKQARDHFSLLSSLSSGDEGQWVDAFVDEEPKSLLTKIQSDILYLAEPEPHAYLLEQDDDSVQIHVCHSALRQLEVLRDQLIQWLSQSTAEQPRRPSDVLVLVPDIKQVESLIRSVFPHVPKQNSIYLPIKIAGVTQLDASNAWRAVLGRIQLVQGRFSTEDFADWLNLNAVLLRYELDLNSTARMMELLIQAGFKRGLDEQHLAEQLSENDRDYRFSLKFALDRLVLGVAVPEHAMFGTTLSFSQVLPGDFELVSKLIQIYQDFALRRHWMTAHEKKSAGSEIGVEKWLVILTREIEEFEQYGVESLTVVKKILKKHDTMLSLAYRNEQDADRSSELRRLNLPLPYLLTEIQNTLDNQFDQAVPTGQITFSQIGQIRPVPYSLVVLLNMDSGKFPDRNQNLPFDLMALLKPQLGDRSRLEDDQGAFLDALLLAKQSFWMFYNGFDVSDGEVREPSSVVQELITHMALISSTCDSSAEAAETATMIRLHEIEIPAQLKSLYHVHTLQPFDPVGYELSENTRYQDQWFQVATRLHQQNVQNSRQGWVNSAYPLEQDSTVVLDAGQWIQDMIFPARLYLKTLGVANLQPEDIPEDNEPLVLDGLGRYVIRDYLKKQGEQPVHPDLLMDRLPVGKVQHSAWQISLAEQDSLKKRLSRYAEEETPVTQKQWRIQPDLIISLTVPEQKAEQWVSLDASSGRAKRRAKVWLEYLLWLAYADLNDEESVHLKRIAVFSDVTLINTGLSSAQARDCLQGWFKAFAYGQTQPLVLPAALLMKPAEKAKELEWLVDESGHAVPELQGDLLKEWNGDAARFSSAFSIEDNEATKFHRDWQFILQEQDTTVLLEHCCDLFAHELYQPIYQYQSVEEA
ncbi:exodeoxyribonuclease V subunit gamma [Acinetobacter chinensis]|uniref:exodeoxyribonuclease V subunit gamma n=1 Tax=Acinetobacter chinensis TaxID=2004650 RepID=UPI0029346B6A|nr:exodeoxyribonuclease V subunit gamma [Acinetobacter chinensis]WOE41922.1 exodeoxyribonuclease V subunit gamma [Acinetobacter chinensis]